MDPHHFDAYPDADLDSTYHPEGDPEADPDSDLYVFDTDPDPTFHPDPDPDSGYQIKAQTLEKVLK